MTHLSLNGNAVLFTFLILGLVIVLSIIGLRYYWKYKLQKAVTRSNDSPLKNTGGLHAFGICIALVSAITLMSWTKSEPTVVNYTVEDVETQEEIEIPVTYHVERKRKPLPPPPPENKIIEEVEDLKVEIEIEKIPIEVPEDVVVVESEDAVIAPTAPVAPPPLPPENTDDIDGGEIFVRVEHMPKFPGCASEDLTDEEEQVCSDKRLMTYIAKKLKYPAIARQNGIEGRVFVEFVVDKKGNVGDVKVLRDIGAGCGEAAKRVVESMVKDNGLWTPGKQRMRNVKVKYTIPFTFQLAN